VNGAACPQIMPRRAGLRARDGTRRRRMSTDDATPTFALPTGEPGRTRTFEEAWSAMRDTLVRGLAHALSNRIATIASVAELLRLGGEESSSLATMLGAESTRLEELLEQMRALAAYSSGRQSAFRLSDAVSAAMALHACHPERHSVKLTVHADDDSRPVLGDSTRLQRLLVILLDAATTAAMARAEKVVRLRYGIEGRAGVVRISAGVDALGSETPACAAGAVALAIAEDDAGASYLLALPALAATG
jgi:signal transduction histidine kinase